MNNPLTTHESALVLNFGSLLKDLNAARHGAIAQDNAWIVKKIDEASAQITAALAGFARSWAGDGECVPLHEGAVANLVEQAQKLIDRDLWQFNTDPEIEFAELLGPAAASR